MTQDEIIRMAREAGWQYADGDDGYKPLWRFAALVAANEREKQTKQEPGEWINEDELPEFYPYDDMYQSSKVINGVRMFPNVKVSDRPMFYALTKDHTWISVTETQFNILKPEYRMKCYATPVSIEAAVLAEREACAEEAESAASDDNKYDIAAAIRARSDQ